MAALGVVPSLNPLEDGQCQLLAVLPAVLVEQLELQGPEEALGNGIVETVADRPHGPEQPSAAKAPAEGPRRVSRPVVAVGDGRSRCRMVRDPAPGDDPMTVAPLGADQVTMPSADRVGRDEGRQTLPDWSQALEDREHPSLFGPEPWSGHLSAEYVQLLAQDQKLEVFGPRRATPEQEQAKDLLQTESSEMKGR